MAILVRSSEGEPLSISRQVAEQWDWFRPIIQGKFLAESTYEVPLEPSLLHKWYELATTAAGESVLPLHRYSDVSEALLFFSPSNEEWRAYVDVQELDKEERLTHYETLGREIRQRGSRREWLEGLTNAPLHCNFYCHCDPVYSWTTQEFYTDQLMPSDKAVALQHADISIITGIMQSAWVSQMVEGAAIPGHEVSWQYIDWVAVGAVKYPNKLFSVYNNAVTGGPTTRQGALKKLSSDSERQRQRLTYPQAALVYRYDPEGSGHKNIDTMAVDMATLPTRLYKERADKIQEPAELIVELEYDEHTDKTKLTTNIDYPLELYSIFLAKLADDDFHSYVYLRGGYSDIAADMLSHTLLELCGAVDLLTPEKSQHSSSEGMEYHMWSTTKNHYRQQGESRPVYNICETITTLLLRQGRALKSTTETNEDKIPEEDYVDIVKYAISVVGSEAVADLAAVIMKVYEYSEVQRLFKFAETVYTLMPDEVVEGQGF